MVALTAFQFCCFASLFFEQQFGVQSRLCFVAILSPIASSVQFSILYFRYAIQLCYYAVQSCCYAVQSCSYAVLKCCYAVPMCCSVAVQPRAVPAGRAGLELVEKPTCRILVCVRRAGDIPDWTIWLDNFSGKIFRQMSATLRSFPLRRKPERMRKEKEKWMGQKSPLHALSRNFAHNIQV